MLLQLSANLWALVLIWYLLVRATLGKAYLCTNPDSLATIRILSLAAMQQIASFVCANPSPPSSDFADEPRLAVADLALNTEPGIEFCDS